MKKNPVKSVLGIIFLVVVFIVCVIASLDFIDRAVHYQKFFLILTGILGVVLYLFKMRISLLLLYSWILLQLATVDVLTGEQVIPMVDFHLLVEPVFFSQFQFGEDLYQIGLNPFPLLCLPFALMLRFRTIIGEELTVNLFRENDWLADRLPQQVKVLDRVNFNGNKDWLVVHLSKGITFDGTSYYHALLKAKDYVAFKRNRPRIAHFRLFDGQQRPGPEQPLEMFPFIDWVVVK